jgi:hypothetical protein
VRVLPTFPVARCHSVQDETSKPAFLRSPGGVTGLLEASVGRWPRFLGRGSTPPQHGRIMPELAREMQHVRTVMPGTALHKNISRAQSRVRL